MHEIDREEIENSLIDSRNSDLWKYLMSRYKIKVFQDDEGNSRVQDTGNGYMIVLVCDNFNNEVFTHEMLHIYIIDKYFDIINYLYDICDSKPSLKSIFPYSVACFINNMLSHMLMYPIYEKMGYDMTTFTPPVNVEYVNNLIPEFSKIDLSNGTVVYYNITNFIAYEIMMLSESWHYDYSEHLDILKEKDADLFKITEDLVVNWKDTDNTEDLKLLLDKFMVSLNDWIIKKRQS